MVSRDLPDLTARFDMDVADLAARLLEVCRVRAVFGVISIHNLPMLAALNRRGVIRFVPSRGEAGGTNMADAYARVTGGLGVVFTSTGTAAGNAAGALIEAQTAGTPLLHLTGQIDSPFLDEGRGFIHESLGQTCMLGAISKACFRVRSPDEACDILSEAARIALTAPQGPVSVEIPIDIQSERISCPVDLSPPRVEPKQPDAGRMDRIVEAFRGARRPMIWLGGGARHASDAARKLADFGIGIVTSTNGRGIVPEDHPSSIGSYTLAPSSVDLYATVDLMLVVGSRLRSNETHVYELPLPENLYQVDADPEADARSYPNRGFVEADSAVVLAELSERLHGKLSIDPGFAEDVRASRQASEARLISELGPHAKLVSQLQCLMPRNSPWVRDVTVSNSAWGNRLLKIFRSRDSVHAVGGGIGQGLAMGIGAAVAVEGQKVVALCGDGGLALSLGELATAVQENVNMILLLMNDHGYQVIRNIQAASGETQSFYTDLHTPDFEKLAASLSLEYRAVSSVQEFSGAFEELLDVEGPSMLEIDVNAIGAFSKPFAGPPMGYKNSAGCGS